MNHHLWRRRTFLKTIGAGLTSVSAVSLVPAALDAGTLAILPPQAPASRVPKQSPLRINVRDFGAVGDGKAKDTLALQQALDRCYVLGGGEVIVPPGEYLTGALGLRSHTVLLLDEGATLHGSPDLADYPIAQVRWEGRWSKGHIGLLYAIEARDIAIAGRGKVLGNLSIKGRLDAGTQLRNPALIEFIGCANVRMEDCFTVQNDMWSIHPTCCEDVTFRNLTVHGGADGIDVDSCRRVVIDGCDFATGDDCISLKSGRGAEGYALMRTTEDVRISHCTFSDRHWACIGIGSETSGGIRNVRVEHCRCVGAKTFAIYIKSRPGRGAFIEDIYMRDLEVSGAQGGFLRINMLNSGKQDEFPVSGDEGIPSIRNFRFENVRVTDAPVLVDASSIHPAKPLDGFSLVHVSGTCARGILLANIRHAELGKINVAGYSGPLLSAWNVSGTGLAGAATLPPSTLPDPVAVPAQPYELH